MTAACVCVLNQLKSQPLTNIHHVIWALVYKHRKSSAAYKLSPSISRIQIESSRLCPAIPRKKGEKKRIHQASSDIFGKVSALNSILSVVLRIIAKKINQIWNSNELNLISEAKKTQIIEVQLIF